MIKKKVKTMDLDEQLETLIHSETVDAQQVKVLASQVKDVIIGLKSQENIANSKLQDAITSRDKAKQLLQGVKGSLGLDEKSELDLTLLDSRLNSTSEDVKKVEARYSEQLQSVSAKAKEKEEELHQELEGYKQNMQVMKMQTELSKVSYNALDANADSLVKNLLSDSANFEDGSIVYKIDGVVQKNSNGINLSVQDKINQLQDTHSFLFKSEAQPTAPTTIGYGGVQHNNGSSRNSGVDMIKAKAKQLGIQLPNGI